MSDTFLEKKKHLSCLAIKHRSELFYGIVMWVCLVAWEDKPLIQLLFELIELGH